MVVVKWHPSPLPGQLTTADFIGRIGTIGLAIAAPAERYASAIGCIEHLQVTVQLEKYLLHFVVQRGRVTRCGLGHPGHGQSIVVRRMASSRTGPRLFKLTAAAAVVGDSGGFVRGLLLLFHDQVLINEFLVLIHQ